MLHFKRRAAISVLVAGAAAAQRPTLPTASHDGVARVACQKVYKVCRGTEAPNGVGPGVNFWLAAWRLFWYGRGFDVWRRWVAGEGQDCGNACLQLVGIQVKAPAVLQQKDTSPPRPGMDAKRQAGSLPSGEDIGSDTSNNGQGYKLGADSLGSYGGSVEKPDPPAIVLIICASDGPGR